MNVANILHDTFYGILAELTTGRLKQISKTECGLIEKALV
jgi:hypothetical protein